LTKHGYFSISHIDIKKAFIKSETALKLQKP